MLHQFRLPVYSTFLHGQSILYVHREGVLRLRSKFVASEIDTTQPLSFNCSNFCTAVVEIFERQVHLVIISTNSPGAEIGKSANIRRTFNGTFPSNPPITYYL